MKKSSLIGLSLIILATVLYFVANLQRVAIPGAIFDLLQQDLHTSAKNITALGTTFMYVYAISQLGVGVLVTKYGGFRVISAGGILFFLGCILFPISHILPILYLARILIGIGSATFYLGIIDEMKRLIPSRNFGLMLSAILLIGYMGGIIANAPLLCLIDKTGWREAFLIIGFATATVTILFLILKFFNGNRPVDKSINFNTDLFKEVLTNKQNLTLYSTVCINYALYYLIQTILGKKFLEDFCQISAMTAATILSIMGALFAISGPLCAFVSKIVLYRKTIFFKLTSLNLLMIFAVTLICLCFDVRTPIIGMLFCLMPLGTNLSPLAVPLLQSYNTQRASATAVSCMTCGFYVLVGILGSVAGMLMDALTPISHAGAKVYSTQSYIAIFSIMLVLSALSFINVFRISESKKTIQLIKHVQYLRTHSDKYTPEDYNNYIN